MSMKITALNSILQEYGQRSGDDEDKSTRLDILRYACSYLKQAAYADALEGFCGRELDSLVDPRLGFAMVVDSLGQLIFVSESIGSHLRFSQRTMLETYDHISQFIHPKDLKFFYQKSSVANLFISKRSRYGMHAKNYNLFKITTNTTRLTFGPSPQEAHVCLAEPIIDANNKAALLRNNPFCMHSMHGPTLCFRNTSYEFETIMGYKKTDIVIEACTLYDLIQYTDVDQLRKMHKSIVSSASKSVQTLFAKLLTKAGTYINALMIFEWMPYQQSIAVSYQVFSEKDAEVYKRYSQTEHAKEIEHAKISLVTGATAGGKRRFDAINTVAKRLKLQPIDQEIDGWIEGIDIGDLLM